MGGRWVDRCMDDKPESRRRLGEEGGCHTEENFAILRGATIFQIILKILKNPIKYIFSFQ